MPTRKRSTSKDAEAGNGNTGHTDAHSDADEKAIDPTLESEHEVSDKDMERAGPAKKRKTSKGDSSTATTKKSKAALGGAKRSDWNPKPGKLPEDKTPLQSLREELKKRGDRKKEAEGGNVLWVMGMKSIRIEDNRGLAEASRIAALRRKGGKAESGNLIVAFFISPQDWHLHDRSPRKVDFVLRNLKEVKKQLDELNIPFVVYTEETRKQIPSTLVKFAKDWSVTDIIGNVEYEVDEIWRDIAILKESQKAGIHADFVEDAYVVPAGELVSQQGRPYAVFSPWNRSWTDYLAKNLHLTEASEDPEPNDKSIHSGKLGKLFKDQGAGFGIPDSVPGFECKDVEYMKKLWPAGSASARKVLDNFMKRKGGELGIDEPATGESWDVVGTDSKDSRLNRYGIGRNLMSENGTSRLSPYLASGIMSPRACLRATMSVEKNKLKVGRGTGTEMWNTEISFRDFYAHVLAAWPRVCMTRAFIPKYEDVAWEYDDKVLEAWQQGKTGYPIVDASMRQCAKQGWMHNRGRMTVAMFLTKHLMTDWRLGEQWFNHHLIDADFSSNNAGWQWSASTGCDPQPYFRIFNPVSQSTKCDPRGEYIKHWVPELRSLDSTKVHMPFERLSKEEFKKLGYPEPIVEHKWARERALRRFKEPGTK